MADTPGPAILCPPTSERLEIIIFNCAVRITHESPKLLEKESHIWLGMMVPPHIQEHRPLEWIYIIKGAIYLRLCRLLQRNWKISWNLQDTPNKASKASNSSSAKMANCYGIKAEGQSDGKGWHNS